MVIKIILLVVLFALPVFLNGQVLAQHDWENPHVLGINKLPYHATLQFRHPQDVRRDGLMHLNIDLNVHGVGGINTWGSRTSPQYTLPGNVSYHYGFIIKF